MLDIHPMVSKKVARKIKVDSIFYTPRDFQEFVGLRSIMRLRNKLFVMVHCDCEKRPFPFMSYKWGVVYSIPFYTRIISRHRAKHKLPK